MKWISLLPALFLASNVFGQSVEAICNTLAESKQFESATVGYAGSTSEFYQNLQALYSISTVGQLDSIASSTDNNILKLAALVCLKRKDLAVANKVANKIGAIQDKTMVPVMNGDIRMDKAVAVIYLSETLLLPEDTTKHEFKKNKFK